MDFIFDPSLMLYLPLYKLDGASFMSKDAYGHLAIVTGATWGIQGKIFDGVDDLINCGRITALEGVTAEYTIEIWLKMTDNLTNYRCLFAYDGNDVLGAAADIYAYWSTKADQLRIGTGAASGEEITSAINSFDDLAWHHLALVKTSTNILTYDNAVLKDNLVQAGNAFSSAYEFHIGDNYNINHWKGIDGEVRIYSRALTPLEIQRNYLATKWRYQ